MIAAIAGPRMLNALAAIGRALLVAVGAGALLLTAGCATVRPPVEKPVTDFKQVTGSWNGTT